MWTIRENAGRWELVDADGKVVATRERYELALGDLADRLAAAVGDQAMPTGGGLLPERWEDVAGIAFSVDPKDGRDFTDCVWTSRDPAVSLMPLMLQTETDIGHFGAVLAGYIEELTTNGSTPPRASGRFYDSEPGRQFRDMLLDGRRFGVSVDPGEVDYEWICSEMDVDGWCISEQMQVHGYEIIGLTGTPFPAFAEAAIQLASDQAAPAAGDVEQPAAVAAGGSPGPLTRNVPAVPPSQWFEMAEPKLGDPRLVEQWYENGEPSGKYAVPLTIERDDQGLPTGLVYGHLAWWGQCHVGFPDQCIEPPQSPTGYARFNLRALPTSGGGTVLTGPLVVGTEHYDRSLFAQATDPFAHVDLAWADVHVVDGEHGPWVCGALRPGITDAQLRVLDASSVSGEWHDEGAGLDLVLGLTVNMPGFPIRAQALAASGYGERLMTASPRARVRGGRVVALRSANVVRRECSTCGGHTATTAGTRRPGPTTGRDDQLDRIEATLRRLDVRTRHLRQAAATAALEQVNRPAR